VDGWHGDTSSMFLVGQTMQEAPPATQRLLRVTHEALETAIALVRPGTFLGDIGHAIQMHAEKHNLTVVEDYCGHGIGKTFHAPPSVLHFGRPGDGLRLEEGMFFTIEPMLNLGRSATKVLKDEWTVVTKDKSLSAQYEHTLGVTHDGCEVFTRIVS